MGAVVHCLRFVPAQRAVIDKPDARVTKLLPLIARHFLRANCVHDERDLNAAPRGGRERIGELARQLSFFVVVGFEPGNAFRVIDGSEHRGQKLVAVRQHHIRVTARGLRADQRGQVRKEPWVGGPVLAVDLERHAILAEREQHAHDPHDDQDRDDEFVVVAKDVMPFAAVPVLKHGPAICKTDARHLECKTADVDESAAGKC